MIVKLQGKKTYYLYILLATSVSHINLYFARFGTKSRRVRTPFDPESAPLELMRTRRHLIIPEGVEQPPVDSLRFLGLYRL